MAEQISYVNGSTDVKATYTVLNVADGPVVLNARLYAAGNLNVAGDECGAGFLDPGPPRSLGGINQAAGGSARLIEQTPAWNHYQEGAASGVFAAIANTDPSAPGFSDGMDPTVVDNGAGVQWDFPTLANLAPQGVSMVWRFKRFAAAPARRGLFVARDGPAGHGDGECAERRQSRGRRGGALRDRRRQPGSGAVTTGADGTAAITWAGANLGTDTLTAFIDGNANGVRDAGEPQQTVTVSWTPPPPPVPGKSVVAKVVSGTVFVKYPPGYVPRAAPAPPAGFVPFKGGANLPVGTQLDTTHGRVALTSAADTGGAKTQTSDFYDGIFQIKQTAAQEEAEEAGGSGHGRRPEGRDPALAMRAVKGARSAVADAAKKKKGPKSVLGKLWGSGKGKFRTGGKYSSATVRGTIWLVEDRCEGTFTKVKRGTVQVRDLRRKKTVTVKAGHTYLARAAKRGRHVEALGSRRRPRGPR